jgi:hypothetical protein
VGPRAGLNAVDYRNRTAAIQPAARRYIVSANLAPLVRLSFVNSGKVIFA